MSSSGGSVNVALTAPLELPAAVGKPLTTQGGNTLDGGTGGMTVSVSGTGSQAEALALTDSVSGLSTYLRTNGTGLQVLNSAFSLPVMLVDQFGTLQVASHVNATPTTPALPANPPVSGTVYQNVTGGPIIIKVPVTATAIGGSAQLALGATNAPTSFGGAEQIGVSGETHNVDLTVPNGWYWSITTVSAVIGTASVLGL